MLHALMEEVWIDVLERAVNVDDMAVEMCRIYHDRALDAFYRDDFRECIQHLRRAAQFCDAYDRPLRKMSDWFDVPRQPVRRSWLMVSLLTASQSPALSSACE